ncbi:chromosomal replication initiator protein [Rubritalea squalenifaciens DSM 18772]|uniref:Chromosomal replication initiator protein DnaA n=2 Tax=Rubritalea TaxID=361050 RepID=A0A1M6HWC4_9BACT|nr:chromosomal replication initiator protein DnaA [Rubritalea squalenifaciens]SHJ26536.1 chromosomal replication initiator protein [Rubritalea squalenifaciens DSM 18772]
MQESTPQLNGTLETTPTYAPNGSHVTIWNAVAEKLKTLVSTDAFARWFAGAQCFSLNQTEICISVPSDIHQVWIETNFMPELQSAVSAVLEATVVARVAVAGQEELFEERVEKVQLPGTQPARKQQRELNDGQLEKKLKTIGLNPLFSFKRFVVGQNSEFAHAACTAVASGSGVAYNPLFIHGGSGLGKTHLMQAIGQRIVDENPDAKVVYLTSEKFTNQFIDAVKKGDLEKFRRKYRKADVLLIDDIQFLAGKERSQEEFFHTFNTLLDLQSQIVLTSDRPACEIKNFEPRLISRFESGLTVELQSPRMETRVAILRRKMEDWDVKLSDEVIRFLAERIRSNVRRLEGALVRLATFASLGGNAVDVERAESLLRDILREEGAKTVTIDSIQKVVSEHFDVRLADMSSRRRPANIAFARQVAMYLSRKLTPSSLMEIGDAFGGRDHGTVIHAVKKVEQRIDKEGTVRDTVDLLDAMLQR